MNISTTSIKVDPLSEKPDSRFQSRIDITDSNFNEKKWEWLHLREKCRDFELETYFRTYMQRLISSYLCLFLVLLWVIVILHSVMIFSVIKRKEDIYTDIVVYILSTVMICMILAITFDENLIKHYPWVSDVCSWFAIMTLVATDIGLVVFHGISTDATLRPSFACFVLYSIYFCMPVMQHSNAIVLGLTATIAYIICFGYITYTDHVDEKRYMHMPELITEVVFLLTVNMIGIFARLSKEVAIRTTFLDRRQCLEENLLFRFARDQERGLLLRILPEQIANKIQQDVKLRIERQKQHAPEGQEYLVELRKLFIEPHNDVTILYADVVNYTYLTTTLDVKTLVETIHDLFVKFDIASQRFNVLRIKFLGDCYYCVSGVPIPNEYHAKACVDLGLTMINDIRDVRMKRQLDIDMRIGVHSGSILSGVIGARKWQYDIWSKDVDIANRLEATGVAGRVHVSEQTLKQLDGLYQYEEGTAAAKADEVLRKYDIHTYLIKSSRTSVDTLKHSAGPVNEIEQNGNEQHQEDEPVHFMKTSVVPYSQIRKQATLDMSREMDKMPLSRFQVFKACCGRSNKLREDELEEQTLRRNITSFLLFFKDWRREMFYMNQPDELFKYSIMFGFLTFLSIFVMQMIPHNQSYIFWIIMFITTILLISCIFIAFYRKLWIMLAGETYTSQPKNKCSLVLFQLSTGIQQNTIARIIIYVMLLAMQCSALLLQLVDCDKTEIQNENFNDNVLDKQNFSFDCFYPWGVTNGWALLICTIFVFTRILFVMKLILGAFMVLIYISLVMCDYDIIYERSDTTNVRYPAEYAHLMVPLITLLVFHLMDRQTEFISKVDYNWKRQVLKKQNDAKFTNETIKILINNILPAHVADIYITKQMQHELYYEEYDNVAIMFATIKNYDAENFGLRILNEIICDFDEILSFYSGAYKIEKIKVAGWTYMAACGLEAERNEKSYSYMGPIDSAALYNRRRSPLIDDHRSVLSSFVSARTSSLTYYSLDSDNLINTDSSTPNPEGLFSSTSTRSHTISPPQHSNVVYVMAKFALDLMRTLRIFNTESLQIDDNGPDAGRLRIGISNGEIMAGVVGSYKPHYDIWGNAVNMASRLDSTGIPGSIQVTENTASILEAFGVKCNYRGMTFIKGRGNTPTYFVGIDKDMNFIPKDIAALKEKLGEETN